MRTISFEESSDRLAEVLDSVAQEGEVVITRPGRGAVARSPERLRGAQRNRPSHALANQRSAATRRDGTARETAELTAGAARRRQCRGRRRALPLDQEWYASRRWTTETIPMTSRWSTIR